ncbi:GH-E family nuclease [Rhizobium gallicum]|uniref:GH-E family nuclease n=1 Tax=Rhizobium gallicum TaxID=56730 RepID=UPI0009F898BE
MEQHKPGHEYRTLHQDYMEGRLSKDEFARQYRDPNNYQPESINANRSHRYEAE